MGNNHHSLNLVKRHGPIDYQRPNMVNIQTFTYIGSKAGSRWGMSRRNLRKEAFCEPKRDSIWLKSGTDLRQLKEVKLKLAELEELIKTKVLYDYEFKILYNRKIYGGFPYFRREWFSLDKELTVDDLKPFYAKTDLKLIVKLKK